MTIEPKLGGPFHRSLAARLRSWFFTGLVIFGPVAATAYIAWWVVDTIDNWVRPLAPASLWPDSEVRHAVIVLSYGATSATHVLRMPQRITRQPVLQRAPALTAFHISPLPRHASIEQPYSERYSCVLRHRSAAQLLVVLASTFTISG
jgi:hypothetical protein